MFCRQQNGSAVLTTNDWIPQLYVEGHSVREGYIVSRLLEDAPPVRVYRYTGMREVRAIVERFNRRQLFRALTEHHKALAGGVGRCSNPVWDLHGRPVGFCDSSAFGRQTQILPEVYCAGLACPRHGGPK